MTETIKLLQEIVSKKMGFKEIAMCAGAIPDLLTHIEELERKVAAGEKLAQAVDNLPNEWAGECCGCSNSEIKGLCEGTLLAYRNAK